MPLFSRVNICACTLAQTMFNLLKGSISGDSLESVRIPRSEAVLPPGVPRASSLDVSSAASGDQNPKMSCDGLSACGKNIRIATLSWFVLSLLIHLLSPTLTLYVTFCAFGSEQRLGVVCRNSLGFYHHGLLNIWFHLFGIHNKIGLHFSVHIYRQGLLLILSLFLQGSKLKALRRTSRSPRLAAWKSSGWSIRESAILRAAQMFPEMAG